METGSDLATATLRAPKFKNSTKSLAILVVDDSKSQLVTLSLILRKLGHQVLSASDGRDALCIAEDNHVDMVISDWMMPNMSGIELCEAIRAREQDHYIYFILLTSKKETADLSTGFQAGADDFLSKPVDRDELLARISSGKRIIELNQQLNSKNEQVERAYGELKVMHDAVDKDLMAASKLQKAYIPEAFTSCLGTGVATHYLPAHHIGGDLIGYFQGDDETIVGYSIDVAGHGVSSALLCVQLAQSFDPSNIERNIAFELLPDGSHKLKKPHEIAQQLNVLHQAGPESDLYFTMAITVINIQTGKIELCQCGHPPPALQREDGRVEFIGDGGSPVGLIPFVDYETSEHTIGPGEKLFLYSDGITECENSAGDQFDEDGLANFFTSTQALEAKEQLPNLMIALKDHVGGKTFADDVSAMLIEMPRPNLIGDLPYNQRAA